MSGSIQPQPLPSAPSDFSNFNHQPSPIQQQPGFSVLPGNPPQSNYPPYPTPQPGYPPPANYPPQSGYPPPANYPPQSGYPSPANYPPQSGYPPSSSYPPQPGYPIPQGIPPPHSGYPTQPGFYPPPGQVPTPFPGGLNNVPAESGTAGHHLALLTSLDTLLIKQSTDILQVFLGVRAENNYKIKIPVEGAGQNSGQDILFAAEKSSWLSRLCLGSLHSYEIKIYDFYQKELIRLIRPFGCSPSCCIPNCMQEMIVESPPGQFNGKIEQKMTCCGVTFNVLDHMHQPRLKIKAPSFPCRTSYLCGDVKFRIYKYDSDEKIGRISKQWSGLLREMFTDTDFFGVAFPKDLDVRLKATLLGACFLIDSLFFYHSGND